MINVGFLNQQFLVQKEVINALRRMTGIRVVIITIPDLPSAQQAEKACHALTDNKCSLLFTINDWGIDRFGIIPAYMEKKAGVHVNWCVDDPFFTEIYHNRPSFPKYDRLDFVSNRAYVAQMTSKGFRAFFMPLATDPEIFYPSQTAREYKKDLCFVGNSYRKQLDEFCSGYEDFMDSLVPFMSNLLKHYLTDLTLNIEAQITNKIVSTPLPTGLSQPRAIFIVKHFISYLFRKKFVCGLAESYPGFMVFGDELWLRDLPAAQVFPGVVSYYSQLNEIYQTTKINIDINRVVITEGLTQRVFDCLAGCNFIMTSKKAIVSELFETKGKNQEVVVFDNECHCKELIDYFLKNEEERMTIARRGMNRVMSQHTYHHRIREIFKILSMQLGNIQNE